MAGGTAGSPRDGASVRAGLWYHWWCCIHQCAQRGGLVCREDVARLRVRGVAALVGTAPPVAQMLGRSYNVEACGDWKREEERRWNWMRGTGGCGTIPMARHWLHTAAASGTSSTGERRDRERSRCHPPQKINHGATQCVLEF